MGADAASTHKPAIAAASVLLHAVVALTSCYLLLLSLLVQLLL
jgi:hypothetical protein